MEWLRKRRRASNMNKMIKDALILFAITLVSGLGLGAVYNVTSQARAQQEQKTKNAGSI